MSGRWYSDTSQIAWTCDMLIKGRRISHRDEIAEANGWRLSAIIHQLRHRYGWPILTDYDGNRIGHYQLHKKADTDALDTPPSYRDYLRQKKDKA